MNLENYKRRLTIFTPPTLHELTSILSTCSIYVYWVLYYTVYTQVEAGDGASADNSLSEEDKMRRELADEAERVKEFEEHVFKVENDKRELQKQLTEVDGKWRQVNFQLQVS